MVLNSQQIVLGLSELPFNMQTHRQTEPSLSLKIFEKVN